MLETGCLESKRENAETGAITSNHCTVAKCCGRSTSPEAVMPAVSTVSKEIPVSTRTVF